MKNPSAIKDLSKLCIHTITTKPWDLPTAVERYAAAGVSGITVWRDAAANCPGGIAKAGELCRDAGLEIVSYVRGGFFTGETSGERGTAVEQNKRIIDEAQELGAPLVVLVCGATPGISLPDCRRQIRDGIAACVDHAAQAGVRLGIEPLHPMYADSRSAVNTLSQALDMSLEIESPQVGVTVDVFHLWWDDRLESEIARCGKEEKLFSFHICDWKDQPEDMLNDRGLMGEGVIDVPAIRGWVEATGFKGYNEVEIFSNRYWQEDQDEYLAKIISAYRESS